jgi:hypothetical protein
MRLYIIADAGTRRGGGSAEDDDFYYTRLAGYVIPCGFAVIPFIDVSIAKLGTIGCCQVRRAREPQS